MEIAVLIDKLSLKVLSGSKNLNRNISSVYCSDMLSRVMTSGLKEGLWITVQTHMNVVAVANLLETACVLFPEGLEAESDVLQRSEKEGIPLLSSNLTAYELAGRLYEMGVGRHETSC